MIATMLLLLTAGIGLTQAISDPFAVTLRWLRLGGVIAVTLLVVAVAAVVSTDGWTQTGAIAGIASPAVAFLVQLMAVQLGYRRQQRIAAALGFILATISATVSSAYMISRHIPESAVMPVPVATWISLLITVAISGGLLGGFLMTMLLGHAYLTAGNEMTQAPFRRLVLMLAVLLVLRAVTSVALGLVPWIGSEKIGSQLWMMMIIIARFAVGLLVTIIFTWMTYDCVKRRANQSATGILYVAGVLIIIGEWSALSLLDSTGLLF